MKPPKKTLLAEFREFAIRGNVVDLAVGVVIGGAFGKIVTSLINDVIMPPVGKLLGNVDFKDLHILLQKGTPEIKTANGTVIPAVPDIAIRYGLFLNTIFDFIIIAFVIFLVIKAINRLKRKQEEAPAPAEPTKQEILLTEIRDLLQQQQQKK